MDDFACIGAYTRRFTGCYGGKTSRKHQEERSCGIEGSEKNSCIPHRGMQMLQRKAAIRPFAGNHQAEAGRQLNKNLRLFAECSIIY